MFLDFKVVRSTGIVRLFYCVEALLCLLRIFSRVRARSSKYPILSTFYYTLLAYAVLNSYLAELPSNASDNNNSDYNTQWALPKTSVILTALDYLPLLTSGNLAELPYDALLFFVREKVLQVFDMGNVADRVRRRSTRRQGSTRTVTSSNEATDPEPVDFVTISDDLETGDICLLYRKGVDQPHYAMFLKYEDLGEDSPLLLVKGKTKPLPLDKFNKKGRDVRIISASTRIFYGDYEKVIIQKLTKNKPITGEQVEEVAEAVRKTEFHEDELKIIEDPNLSPESRSQYACTFMLAHVFSGLGCISVEPHTVTPENFISYLNLGKPTSIKLPETRAGPLVAHGSPPLLAKLIDGINPPPDITPVKFDELAPQLKTGDIVLFTGATSSGAIIRLFDNAEFSHVGIVIRRSINAAPLVWEASTNKAGLVDIETGTVTQGVELLPMREKVFSGWYNRVAVRQLEITDEERKEMTKNLLKFKKELGERPYEKSKLELIRSALDFHEDFLTFLKNEEEDLSSLFCSELVAAAYQRMGLLEADTNSDKYKTSNEFTPDDFTSGRDDELSLKHGQLGKEIYIDMKF